MANDRKYTVSNLLYALGNPGAVRRELRRLSVRANAKFYDLFVNDDPVDVMEEDWDNLLLLDACRYDTFADRNFIDGDLQSRISAGSSSGDFLKSNFEDRTYHDTVYVTANPWAHLVKDAFHSIVDLVHDDDCWDDELKTVPPETVVEQTRKVAESFPNKRLIIHFIQPHVPFIGETGREIEFDSGIYGVRDGEVGGHVWSRLPDQGPDAVDRVWEAYYENLDIVLESAKDLTKSLSGKSVISADHGNLIADRTGPIPARGYGHPPYHPLPELVKVPWHVIEGDSRRDVTTDPPQSWDEPLEEEVDERLRDLGYV